ncbi:hypothetical protein LIER_21576 [Lithospermum erythrorhizon]|uniref:Uncharacterized protein n=1 Tax=Lithospermum erythrorhizon TaxID=34254 RepID=A0AAV3QT50_LITER
MTSSAAGNHSLSIDWHLYPTPLATYDQVKASSQLFIETLQTLHAMMGTKFMIPIVGGKDLDLHRLFVEVTTRGGISKILREKRWKEVTAVFNFPSSATNASFILRKYYCSLLLHYEQIYFFKVKGWSPSTFSAEPLHQVSTATVTPHGSSERPEPSQPQRKYVDISPIEVQGVIDGKFESGYLITVRIGSEDFKGVLYQVQQTPSNQVVLSSSQHQSSLAFNGAGNSEGAPGRRKRRKKSEMKKRDPDHPKPNRSGYNFFFAEQHARLKPLHSGKDREISRMIGELWNNLKEPEKAVYQEKALQDKERYKIEMEAYKERLQSEEVDFDAIPIQQKLPQWDVYMIEMDGKSQTETADSCHTGETESSSEKSEQSEDNTIGDKDLKNRGTLKAKDLLSNLDTVILSNEVEPHSQNGGNNNEDADKELSTNIDVGQNLKSFNGKEAAASVGNAILESEGIQLS